MVNIIIGQEDEPDILDESFCTLAPLKDSQFLSQTFLDLIKLGSL